MTKISLSHDTVSPEDIGELIQWLQTNPRLTQGEVVKEFEAAFAKKVGSKYAVFVNSGSSANLLMIYALKIMGKLPNNRVALPALGWATDLAPLIQFGIEPVLLDVGPELIQTTKTLKAMDGCDALLLTSILGLVDNYELILHICNRNNTLLIEDSCESLMSSYKDGRKVGTIGVMGTYSFYFSHHISTIEGGMIVTDDEDYYTVLKMLRSHGWTRDIEPSKARMLKTMFNVSDFNEKFTFYLPGFNVRSTDLQARIGMEQLKKLDSLAKTRYDNLLTYRKYMPVHVQFDLNMSNGFLCNFGFPIHVDNRDKLAAAFDNAGIECRPLISGSFNNQPVWKHYVGKNANTPNADRLTNTGMYLPNHHGLTEDDIKKICLIVKGTV